MFHASGTVVSCTNIFIMWYYYVKWSQAIDSNRMILHTHVLISIMVYLWLLSNEKGYLNMMV